MDGVMPAGQGNEEKIVMVQQTRTPSWRNWSRMMWQNVVDRAVRMVTTFIWITFPLGTGHCRWKLKMKRISREILQKTGAIGDNPRRGPQPQHLVRKRSEHPSPNSTKSARKHKSRIVPNDPTNMTRFSTTFIMISLFATISTVFVCEVMPMGQVAK
ncbi:hypothetical protein KIN20_032987 [Parelaphostrongylus tenuis]|uniref:Uncharacterized protein n=1 Tax=Parelaphostrongylus tenuis TaxID=148309 RepID=A0AAD5WIF3_PARTN|nr:hypothetical protein KIN20_032987 [Parelaphostrongylus tenuis]